MKPTIHPEYHSSVKVTCSCGNTFVTGSTLPQLQTETCSACHPFYTGKQKLIDTSGILERFKKRAEKTATMKAKKTTKKTKA